MQNTEDRELPISTRTPVPEYLARAFPDRAIFVASPATDLAVWPGPPSAPQWGTVMQVAQQAYAGSITKVVIRYGSTDYTVPATITPGSSVELHGFGLLAASSPAVKCGMNCIVKKPDGTYLNGQYNMSSMQNSGQELRFAMLNISVDQAGIWQAIIRYYTID